VLVVVMDCVRASDFPGGADEIADLPFLNRLRSESIVFPRAAAVAPWTIPSHATIFTGKYPWEHRAHAKGNIQLDPTIPRLPALLRPYGYHSISLSANPLLSPAFGLVDGFDAAAWAEWWEPYLRTTRSSTQARDVANDTEQRPSRLQKLHNSSLLRLLHRSADIVYRHPFLVDLTNHVLQRILSPKDTGYSEVARWIEPTFERWLGSFPSSEPFFGFINLLDAHEPYFAEREVIRTASEYLEFMRTPQDRPSVLSGRWTPTTEELDLIHRLYRASFRIIDRRVEQLVAVLRRAGRWDDTLLVLTSDHGQAFGDHGTLFHMHRADEPLIRIPMWVRPPGGRGGGRTAVGWASLVDIAPTVLAEAGGDDGKHLSGVGLPSLVDAARPGPLPLMADGLALDQERRQLSPERQKWIDRTWSAAYEGDAKVVYNISDNELHAYDIAKDPAEAHDLFSPGDPRFARLTAEVQRVADQLVTGRPARLSDDVEDRLRSWGYI
jgi:arylsulfatase A-like enzyme